MSAPIDPQRLALAREYARARRSDRLAATLTDLLSEVLADRDRLARERDNARFAAENYRERYMSANDDPTCPALAWADEAGS